ncbi:MAG TPA: hypothetical protein VK137_03215 [Planctomycetaceae bacterium]|nr:hypothetical protein [Planctomycetaceae bacterium]
MVAAWRHESGESFASVLLYAPSTQLNGAATITFVSAFAGDSFLVSTASRLAESGPPTVRVNTFLGASAETLWASHRRKLTQEKERQPIVRLSSPDDVRSTLAGSSIKGRNASTGRSISGVAGGGRIIHESPRNTGPNRSRTGPRSVSDADGWVTGKETWCWVSPAVADCSRWSIDAHASVSGTCPQQDVAPCASASPTSARKTSRHAAAVAHVRQRQ